MLKGRFCQISRTRALLITRILFKVLGQKSILYLYTYLENMHIILPDIEGVLLRVLELSIHGNEQIIKSLMMLGFMFIDLMPSSFNNSTKMAHLNTVKLPRNNDIF